MEGGKGGRGNLTWTLIEIIFSSRKRAFLVEKDEKFVVEIERDERE